MTEWQPIETAPKDGTEILLFSKDFGRWIDQWTNIEGQEMWMMCDQWEIKSIPTKWMHLPDAPKD